MSSTSTENSDTSLIITNPRMCRLTLPSISTDGTIIQEQYVTIDPYIINLNYYLEHDEY